MDTTNTPGNANTQPGNNSPSSSPSATAPVQSEGPTPITPPADPAKPPTPQTPPNSSESGKKKLPTFFILLLLVLSFIVGLLMATWYFQSQLQMKDKERASTHTKDASQTKTLTIGTDATAPPMEYMNKEGAIIGHDIDLGYLIGNELGYKVTFKNITWGEIFTQLKEKKIDMIISSATITEERKKEFIFSDSYIIAGQVIVSRKDNPIKSPEELKGKKIAVQKNTTNEKEALKLTSKNLVMSMDEFTDATKAVSTGKADALISDLTLAKGLISQYENLKITSDPFTNEYYGIVLHKDNKELLAQVNKALSTFKIKGILTDLKQRWLE